MKSKRKPIDELISIMAKLRSPEGCPWDREQSHITLRRHAVEEVYELIDAIEAGDDDEMIEELGDLLLQVVFHCQLAAERDAFNFDDVSRRIAEKLVRRHPHVFADGKAKTVEAVWTEWEKIKKAEKAGTKNERSSALDGIPKHLPALLRAEKLLKKATKAGLAEPPLKGKERTTRKQMQKELFDLAKRAWAKGWSPEELLAAEVKSQEKTFRKIEKQRANT